ncbi:MAG: virulence factor MviN, partial [Cellulomonas sp.]|nr:virulence factor MviN [Cellulomonas sp.]
AVAGRWVADAVSHVAGTGAWTALGAAAGAGLVALLVVVGAVLGLDRETVHGMLRAEHEPARS